MTEFEKLVNETVTQWLAHSEWQAIAIGRCAQNARLAVRVYVRLQNSRGLKPGHTRKDFVARLDDAHGLLQAAA